MRILIVGGYGRMGRWFVRFLQRRGLREIYITGRNEKKAVSVSRLLGVKVFQKPSPTFDIIIFSTPPSSIPQLYERYLGFQPNFFVEIASVKKSILEALTYPSNLLSIHPFFGPRVRSLRGKNVVWVHPKTPTAHERRFLDLFRSEGASVFYVPPDVHDEAIKYTLSLPHLFTLLLGRAIRSSEIDRQLISALSGGSFKKFETLLRSMALESPEVYSEIQLLSPSYSNILRDISSQLLSLAEDYERGVSQNFREIMAATTKYFSRKKDLSNKLENS
ncbi:hypothetical protein B6U74_00850 [Candidatus Bathyarchaeota archaeon ex4484_205]|nr:MAG: hypothetical protein B6U74_00850 [Candidatus Bathyarchaeota archaeon ex4484_205]RLG67105.1 MAG: hypothetical protein DRN93_05095 [archaeon]